MFTPMDLENNPGNFLEEIAQLKARLDVLEKAVPLGMFKGDTLTPSGPVDVPSGELRSHKRALIQGWLSVGDYVRHNIVGDAITVDSSYIRVYGEGDVDDDLSTINGGRGGDLLFVRAYHDALTVTVKDAVGNLRLAKADFALDDTEDVLMLMYCGALKQWLEVSRSDNS